MHGPSRVDSSDEPHHGDSQAPRERGATSYSFFSSFFCPGFGGARNTGAGPAGFGGGEPIAGRSSRVVPRVGSPVRGIAGANGPCGGGGAPTLLSDGKLGAGGLLGSFVGSTPSNVCRRRIVGASLSGLASGGVAAGGVTGPGMNSDVARGVGAGGGAAAGAAAFTSGAAPGVNGIVPPTRGAPMTGGATGSGV
jgi:hypothetical protein